MIILFSPFLAISACLQKCSLILNILWKKTGVGWCTPKDTHNLSKKGPEILTENQEKGEWSRFHDYWCRAVYTTLPAPAHPASKNHGPIIISSSHENIWGTRRLTHSRQVTQLLTAGLGFDPRYFWPPSMFHDAMMPKMMPELFRDASLCWNSHC